MTRWSRWRTTCCCLELERVTQFADHYSGLLENFGFDSCLMYAASPQLFCPSRCEAAYYEGPSVAPLLCGVATHGGRYVWPGFVELPERLAIGAPPCVFPCEPCSHFPWGAGGALQLGHLRLSGGLGPTCASYERGPLVNDPYYRAHLGGLILEDAVLHMSCQAAKLNGLLCGDNMADSVVTTREDAVYMADLAKTFVKSIQVFLGPFHTSKLHRLSGHRLQELLNRGNLWECDTSTNESQHSSVKQM